MKWVFLGILGVLIAWSLLAYAMMPDASRDGRTVLTWVSDDNPARRGSIRLFEQLNPDLRLLLDPANTTLEKIIVQCKGGVGGDVFNCYGRWQLVDFVRAGVLQPIDEEAARLGFDVAKTWPEVLDEISIEAFNPAAGRYERHQYTFPLNVNANVMFFNKRIFDEVGEPYPTSDWDWNECLRVAKKLVKRDRHGRITRYGLGTYEMHETVGLVWQFGGSFFDPTLTYCTLDSSEAIEAMRFLHRMLVVDEVMPSVAERNAIGTQGGWGSSVIDLFCTERIAMLRMGRWGMIKFRTQPNLRGNIGAVLLPHMRSGADEIRALSVGINPKSPNKNEALRFLQFLASDEFSWQVVESADALPPSPKVGQDERFLKDAAHPEEDFNHLFIEAIRRGRSNHFPPFIQTTRVERIFNRHLAVMSDRKTTPEQMCRALTDEINEEMRVSLTRYASMREEYKRRTGRDFDPADYPPKGDRPSAGRNPSAPGSRNAHARRTDERP
ncbi:MAG TPA: extracellular solute-binding protein [Phycisphaerae bacterium]|nr:extracellular solute-binding protein [Phycisphaerae bacterium]